MDALMQLLQNNPAVILIMFVISLLSGIIGISIGWRKFYEDVLSKKVTLPVYAYLIAFFFVALFIIFWPAVEDRPKKLRTIEGEAFGVQRIIVDGKRFVNCTFRKTELVFRGEASSEITNCTLIQPSLTFDGPAAATVNILTSLYKIPQLKPYIDNTFKAIKEGKLPMSIPPSDAAAE